MNPDKQYHAIHPHRLLIEGDTTMYLRLSSHDDAEELYKVISHNRQHLSKNQTWAKHIDFLTLDQSIKNSVGQIHADRWLQYRIMAAAPGGGQHMVGTVTLYDRDVLGRSAKLSCWLAEDAEGKGYARRAINRLLQYAFSKWNIDSVITDVKEGSERTEQLLAKLGGKPTGSTREGELHGESVRYTEWVIHT